MTPAEYQKVKAIFQSAMEIEESKRAAFLDNNCQNDELRSEVEKLLNNYESGFMEDTAIQDFGDSAVSKDSLVTGEQIGRYEILSRIGKGGMGEVYLAHDKSLGRDVAIKVLLPEFISDRERVNRFKLEAKAASALNHPNIITIHEVGEDDGKLFIATEQIVGETLRSLISHKSLTLATSIKIAEQIASALTSAHKAGIIHRDIKPENIMVREDGFVKVLDFGLAKPTITKSEADTLDLVETKKGMIMGSVGYMSPEQARGNAVDARTDLWSIGVVFYEMLTGKTPFLGDTMTDILANIIHKEPIPIAEQIEAPTELYRIVKKSLRKESDERYQNAKDLSLDLKNLRREMELEHELELSVSPERRQEIRSRSNDIRQTADSGKETNEVRETRNLSNPDITGTSVEIAMARLLNRRGILVAIRTILSVFLQYAGFNYFKPKKLINTLFRTVLVEKISLRENAGKAAISPDGKYIAYADKEVGKRLILRQVETGSEKEIYSSDTDLLVVNSFSPDGNYVYFGNVSNDDGKNGIHKIPILGGTATHLENVNSSELLFSPDGRQIFCNSQGNGQDSQLIISDADGKNERILFQSKSEYVTDPKFSPDGDRIIFFYGNISDEVGIDAKLGWIPAEGGEISQIGEKTWDLSISSAHPRAYYQWLPDGSGIIISNKLMFDENGQIYLVSVPDGKIIKVTNDTVNYEELSATRDLKTVVAKKITGLSGIWEFDIASKQTRQITSSSNYSNISGLAVSRGGFGIADAGDRGILIGRPSGKGDFDLNALNLDDNSEKTLISGKGRIENPVVSPDGNYIFFGTNSILKSPTFPTNAVWRAKIDGTDVTQITYPTNSKNQIIGVTADNNVIFREWKNQFQEGTIKYLDILNQQTSYLIDRKDLFITRIDLSPNGKKILYRAHTNAAIDSNVKFYHRLVDFDGQRIVSEGINLVKDSNWRLRFAPDGKSIYYFKWGDPTEIWQFEFATQTSKQVTNFNLDRIFNFAVSRDGKKLYIVRGNTTDEVVLIKNVE